MKKRICLHIVKWILLPIVAVTVVGGCNPSPSESPFSDLPTPEGLIDTSPLREPLTQPGPVFEIDEPVYAGDKEISGTGPANVPIILVDVTEMGTVLGNTVIQETGRFVFNLPKGVLAGHSVGLQIGDLSGTPFNYEDFIASDTYYDYPLIGILFDMVSVGGS